MYKFINDDSQESYLISVDGVDGVGKTTFITLLAQELGYKFAQNSQDPFEIVCVSPFGKTKASLKTDKGASKRTVIKWLLNNVKNGKFSYNEDKDKEIIKNLFFLSNITALQSAMNFKFEGKKVFLFDRSFVTYSVYQGEDVSDFIRCYDTGIVLTDEIENIQTRLKDRESNDEFDSDCIPRMKEFNEKFLDMKNFFKKPNFINYNISNFKPRKNQTFVDVMQSIAKRAVYEIFNVD